MERIYKNKVLIMFCIIMIALFTCVFCACSGESGDPSQEIDPDNGNSQTQDPDDNDDDVVTSDKISSSYYFDDASGVRHIITFNNDLSVSYSLDSDIESGSYVYYNNTLQVTLNGETSTVSYGTEQIVITIGDTEYTMIAMVNYTVTIWSENGDAPLDIDVLNGQTIGDIDTPVYVGYTFEGWMTSNTADAEIFSLATPIVEDTDLYASWSEIPVYNTVTLSDYVSTELSSQSLLVGDSFELAVPTYDSIIASNGEYDVNYGVANTFVGWYSEDGIKLTDETGEGLSDWTNRGDTTLYPMWSIDEDYYTEGFTYSAINNGTEYEVYSNTALKDQNLTVLVIPAYYNGLPVTKVNDLADCLTAEYVYFPSTITDILDEAFSGSYATKSFFTYIANNEDNVNVENSVYTYLDGVVYSNSNRTLELFPVVYVDTDGEVVTEYTVREDVSVIDSYAFYIAIDYYTAADSWVNDRTYYHDELVTINLPDNLMTIGEGAFMNRQKSLSFVNFGEAEDDSIKLTIGDSAFYKCRFLFTYELFNATTDIDYWYVNSELQTNSEGEEVRVKTGDILTLPDNLISIGEDAFYRGGMSSFGSPIKQDQLVIPEGVTSIGENAFYGANGFDELVVASTVSYIGDNAFAWSSNNGSTMTYADVEAGDDAETGFTKITFKPNSDLKEIGIGVFGYGRGIKEVTLPENLEVIEEFAFVNSYFIEEIEFPSTLTTINTLAFGNCINLDADISGVSDVSDDAFGILTTTITSRMLNSASDSYLNAFYYVMDDLYEAGELSDNIKTMYLYNYSSVLNSLALRDSDFFTNNFVLEDYTSYSFANYVTTGTSTYTFIKYVYNNESELDISGEYTAIQTYTNSDGQEVTSEALFTLDDGRITLNSEDENAGIYNGYYDTTSSSQSYYYNYGSYKVTSDGKSIMIIWAYCSSSNSESTIQVDGSINENGVIAFTTRDTATSVYHIVNVTMGKQTADVTFNIDGIEESIKMIVGIAPEEPTKQGYGFIGWSENENGTAEDLYNFANANDETYLYALWESLPDVNVTFNYGDDVTEIATQSQGMAITAPESVPTKDGYKFMGWSTTDGGSGEIYDLSNGAETDIDLYPVWQELEYVNATYYLASYGYLSDYYLTFHEDGVYEFSYSFMSATVTYGWYEWIGDTITLHTVSSTYGDTTGISGWGGTFTDNGDGTLSSDNYKQTSIYAITVTLQDN